ncbi:MAG: hypothetical protein ACK5AZ_06220 [Bryobacteraceae bacterium]
MLWKTRLSIFSILLAVGVPAGASKASLAELKSEPKLEKRAAMALSFADSAVDTSRKAWMAGDMAAFKRNLEEVAEAVDLVLHSLRETGKAPGKMLKHYKRAELKTRDLGRRLQTLENDVAFDDREFVAGIKDRVHDIHEELLFAIMSKR